MSQDLVQEYFKRDLGPAEREALAAQLASDGEANDRFADLARQAYARTGLPEADAAVRWRRLLAALAVLALSAGMGIGLCLALARGQAAAEEAPLSPAAGQALPAEALASPHPTALPAPLPDVEAHLSVESRNAPGQDASFDVQVSLSRAARVKVWVACGAEKKLLAEGPMARGEHQISWQPTGPGNWKVSTECEGKAQERWVWVERR